MNILFRLLVALTLLAAITPVALAQTDPPSDIALNVRPAFSGNYRVGSWIPLYVTVENSGADLAGEVRGFLLGSPISFAVPVELPRGARKAVTLYVRADEFTRRVEVHVVSADKTLATQTVRLLPHLAGDLLVGVISANPAAIRLADQRGAAQQLVPVPLSLADLPEQAQGLQSLATIVIDATPTESLTNAQREALLGWVAQGGQLVVGGGTDARTVLAGLPEALRPATIGSLTESLNPSALGRLIGVESQPATPLPVVQAQLLEGSRSLTGDDPPLLIERRVGQGRVLLLAMPVASPELAAWDAAPTFWVTLLTPPRTPASTITPWAPGSPSLDEFRTLSLTSNLTNLPALDLPGLGLIGGLLIAYILLVGPVTYLVLRWLDRQALGWVVVPAITLVFSLAAYSLGYGLRGGEVVLNQIHLLEPLANDQVRVRSAVGIFSPTARSYDMLIEGSTLVRPASLYGPWGGPQPQGPEGGIFHQQQASVTDFNIGQWTMRGVMIESIQPLGPIEASIQVRDGTFQGEVVNGSKFMLRDVVLVRGTDILRLGDLAPGKRGFGQLKASPNTDPNSSLGWLLYQDQLRMIGAEPPDREIQRRQNVIDSVASVGPYARGSEPVLVAWVDEAPTRVSLPGQLVDSRSLTLLLSRPRLSFADASLDLGRGWVNVESYDAAGQMASCATMMGQGFGTYSGIVDVTLRLPEELRGARVDSLELELRSDGAWPPDSTLELYDRIEGIWVPVTIPNNRRWPLENWQRFFSTTSSDLRMRFSPSGLPGVGSCIVTDLHLKGAIQ